MRNFRLSRGKTYKQHVARPFFFFWFDLVWFGFLTKIRANPNQIIELKNFSNPNQIFEYFGFDLIWFDLIFSNPIHWWWDTSLFYAVSVTYVCINKVLFRWRTFENGIIPLIGVRWPRIEEINSTAVHTHYTLTRIANNRIRKSWTVLRANAGHFVSSADLS